MTRDHRVFGRVLLVIAGLVLIVGGAAAVLLVVSPTAAAVWRGIGPSALRPFGTHADRASSQLAWTLLLVGAVVVAIIAVIAVSTRGGGRTDLVLVDAEPPDRLAGEVRVGAGAVQHAVAEALDALPEVASSSVEVYEVRRVRSLRIRVRPRRGAAPRGIVDDVERIVADLDALLGVRLPVLLHIARGGHGSAKPLRVH